MGMKCLNCKCIFLNVNVYGPTELKSLSHMFESVYMKWNVGLNDYFVFVFVLVNDSASNPDSVRICQSGRARNAVLQILSHSILQIDLPHFWITSNTVLY